MKARWTLSLPQTSRANPVQCCSTHQKKWHSSNDNSSHIHLMTMSLFTPSRIHEDTHSMNPPKNGLIALWPSTNGAIPYFLVLPGGELSITEITEYFIIVHKSLAWIFVQKWVKYCTSVSYYWTHFDFVKHNIYIVLHACSATVWLLYSWADYSCLTHSCGITCMIMRLLPRIHECIIKHSFDEYNSCLILYVCKSVTLYICNSERQSTISMNTTRVSLIHVTTDPFIYWYHMYGTHVFTPRTSIRFNSQTHAHTFYIQLTNTRTYILHSTHKHVLCLWVECMCVCLWVESYRGARCTNGRDTSDNTVTHLMNATCVSLYMYVIACEHTSYFKRTYVHILNEKSPICSEKSDWCTMSLVSHIHVCATRTYMYVQHAHTCMCNTHIHVCATHTYMYGRHAHTCMCDTHTHVCATCTYMYAWHAHTCMGDTHIHVCATHIHMYVRHTYTCMRDTHIHVCATRTYMWQMTNVLIRHSQVWHLSYIRSYVYMYMYMHIYIYMDEYIYICVYIYIYIYMYICTSCCECTH